MDGMTARERHADKYIFIACLVMAAGMFVGGFFCPPMGVIDGSVLKAGGILLGFAALAVAGQNLANGKEVTFKHGETEAKIGNDDEEA
jgi:small neutral amino acid transporter SnatA (MarC family)